MAILDLSQRSLKRVGVALADNLVVALFGLFYIVALARILPQQEFGLVVLFDVIRNFSGLLSLAVGQALIKYFAPPKKDDRAGALTSSVLINLVYLCGASVALLTFRKVLGKVLGAPELSDLLPLLPLLLLVLCIRGLCTQLNTSAQRLGRVLFQDVVFLAAFVAPVVVLHMTRQLDSAYDVILILLFARCVDSCMGVLLSVDLLRFTVPSKVWIKKIWEFARYSFVNSLGVLGFSNNDKLLLSGMLSTAALAEFSAGAVIFNVFMLINSSANMIVFPLAARECSRQSGSVENLRILFVKWAAMFLILSVSISIVLLLFSEKIAYFLYGSKFSMTPLLFRLFAVWGMTLPVSRVGASILNGQGLSSVNARYTWISLIASVILNLLLIRSFGVVGAGIASVITAGIVAVLYYNKMRKSLGVKVSMMSSSIRGFMRVSN